MGVEDRDFSPRFREVAGTPLKKVVEKSGRSMEETYVGGDREEAADCGVAAGLILAFSQISGCATVLYDRGRSPGLSPLRLPLDAIGPVHRLSRIWRC